jgi:hypothetical protein
LLADIGASHTVGIVDDVFAMKIFPGIDSVNMKQPFEDLDLARHARAPKKVGSASSP